MGCCNGCPTPTECRGTGCQRMIAEAKADGSRLAAFAAYKPDIEFAKRTLRYESPFPTNAEGFVAAIEAQEASPKDEASGLVAGERQAAYGPPAENWERTAALWRAQFGWDVTPAQAALAMLLVKTARLAATPDHRDSVVDIHGYADVYWQCVEAE